MPPSRTNTVSWSPIARTEIHSFITSPVFERSLVASIARIGSAAYRYLDQTSLSLALRLSPSQRFEGTVTAPGLLRRPWRTAAASPSLRIRLLCPKLLCQLSPGRVLVLRDSARRATVAPASRYADHAHHTSFVHLLPLHPGNR